MDEGVGLGSRSVPRLLPCLHGMSWWGHWACPKPWSSPGSQLGSPPARSLLSGPQRRGEGSLPALLVEDAAPAHSKLGQVEGKATAAAQTSRRSRNYREKLRASDTQTRTQLGRKHSTERADRSRVVAFLKNTNPVSMQWREEVGDASWPEPRRSAGVLEWSRCRVPPALQLCRWVFLARPQRHGRGHSLQQLPRGLGRGNKVKSATSCGWTAVTRVHQSSGVNADLRSRTQHAWVVQAALRSICEAVLQESTRPRPWGRERSQLERDVRASLKNRPEGQLCFDNKRLKNLKNPNK